MNLDIISERTTVEQSKNYVKKKKKCNDVMPEKSDWAGPWKDTAMTLYACGRLSLRSGHMLLPHTCWSQTLTVRTLNTKTSLLRLIAGLYTVQASYCMSVICILECACTVHTEDSWHLPPVSQLCPYMVKVINTRHMFHRKPSSKHSHPLRSYWRHKTEG